VKSSRERSATSVTIPEMAFGINMLPLLLSRANDVIERPHENRGVQL
jgi:hypothetical protein